MDPGEARAGLPRIVWPYPPPESSLNLPDCPHLTLSWPLSPGPCAAPQPPAVCSCWHLPQPSHQSGLKACQSLCPGAEQAEGSLLISCPSLLAKAAKGTDPPGEGRGCQSKGPVTQGTAAPQNPLLGPRAQPPTKGMANGIFSLEKT